MARRPEVKAPNVKSDVKKIMSEEELAAFKRSLSFLSPYHVREQYKEQIERCRLQGDIPPPYVIQKLVAIWKVLWKQRR
jgi:hypothetical protein